ncbi:MAG: DNA primase small subunit PriS [Haloferacaceae archaeon]
MDGRTREYLRGRFGDYYRGVDLPLPPAADRREWGHIPFTSGGTTMVRHRSLLEIGDLDEFLGREPPRHVYFSAARYEDPGADGMDAKGWRGADLIFDLDADHLPAVDPEASSYAGRLAACKDALVRLLDLLEADFGFGPDDFRVVFSGGRGYHVHVRTPAVRELGSEARREVVDYVRAIDLDYDGLVTTRAVDGTTRRVLRADGGWGRRVHRRLVSVAEDLRAADRPDALARLRAYEGIGEARAETILNAVERTPEAIENGNLEAGGPGMRTLVEALTREVVEEQTVAVDEPVTTDVNRLIRLPGSLHGGTGLVVRPIERDAVDAFDPFVDAVPARFAGREILVDVTDPGEEPVVVGGGSFTPTEGVHSVREPVGVFLMGRGRARKVSEA